ncbi:MAG: DNA repair protein RecN [Gammaproteobacteria bacterium HGW-Gammaproteobacteria-8]|nr:MAG: DNA repair protein RecN [Gammaproteobacteria bacterium HGW-Gammaproteobacteria-8]
MLRSLAIRDFTIIERLELEFEAGFGAITGETGAGKSILVDALAQLLGDRGDSTLAAEGSSQADLTAAFELDPDHPAQAWLAGQAMEADELLLLRRVIPAEGSSRAWVNGQPVTIAQLRELGRLLVEIHGQHEHQRLGQSTHQRQWLDRQIESAVLERVTETAGRHASAVAALESLLAEAGNPTERELVEFQLRELDKLGLAEGELEQLEIEQRRLASIDDLQRGTSLALEALSGDDENSAGHRVNQALRAIQALTDREPELIEAGEMLASAAVNLEEAARSVQRLQDTLEHDPERLAAIEGRLARVLELARKHRIEPAELPARTAELRRRLDRMSAFDEQRGTLESAVAQAQQAWREEARTLNLSRRKAAERLGAEVERALTELGMQEARVEFTIEHDPDAVVNRHGADRVEILFSANPGQSPRPLSRIASGGELSRFSLALIIAAGESGRGTVRIFDEIDAGVGGETAHAVGRFLRRAGRGGQALCVTHLAQVAACADSQWKVSKSGHKGRTRVELQPLDAAGRIDEIARMLGASGSEAARRHAEVLLEQGRDSNAPRQP